MPSFDIVSGEGLCGFNESLFVGLVLWARTHQYHSLIHYPDLQGAWIYGDVGGSRAGGEFWSGSL